MHVSPCCRHSSVQFRLWSRQVTRCPCPAIVRLSKGLWRGAPMKEHDALLIHSWQAVHRLKRLRGVERPRLVDFWVTPAALRMYVLDSSMQSYEWLDGLLGEYPKLHQVFFSSVTHCLPAAPCCLCRSFRFLFKTSPKWGSPQNYILLRSLLLLSLVPLLPLLPGCSPVLTMAPLWRLLPSPNAGASQRAVQLLRQCPYWTLVRWVPESHPVAAVSWVQMQHHWQPHCLTHERRNVPRPTPSI